MPWSSSTGWNTAGWGRAAAAGGGGAGSFALIDSASASSVDAAVAVTTSDLINTTGADLLIILVSNYAAGALATPADSKSNTWTALTTAANSISRAKLYYSKPTTVGASHSVSVTADYSSIYFAAFSGSHVTPFDVEATGSGNSATASAGSGITPSQGQELIIAGVSVHNNSIASINSSFSILESKAPVGGLAFAGALAYKIQTTAVAEDPDWTISGGSDDWAATIASFKDL
jgi:hypothetical protein